MDEIIVLQQRIAELENLERVALVQLAEVRGAKAEAQRMLARMTEKEKTAEAALPAELADNASLQ